MDPLELLQALGYIQPPQMPVRYDPMADAATQIVSPLQIAQAPQTPPMAGPVPGVPEPPPMPPPKGIPLPRRPSPSEGVLLPMPPEGGATVQMPVPGSTPPPPPAFPPGAQPMAPQAAPNGVAGPPNPGPNFPGVPTSDVTETGGTPNPLDLLTQLFEGSPNIEANPSRQGGYGAGPSTAPGGGGSAAGGPSPSRQGGYGTGPQAPVTTPEPAGGSGSTAVSDPAARQRIYQIMSIIGAVLMQPMAPGQNALGQVGKALGAGLLAQDALTRGEQEQADKRILQQQAQQRIDQQGRSVGIDQQRANTDAQRAQAAIAEIQARIPLIASETERQRVQTDLDRLKLEGEPAKQLLGIQELQGRISLLGAQTAAAGAGVETKTDAERRKLTELLQKAGALGTDVSPNFDIDKAITVTSLNPGPRVPMNAEATAKGQTYYEGLRARGMSPAQANQYMFNLAVERGVQPRKWSMPGDK